ncbi:2-hydroxyacylsphingosine 1-beta-galactosyltransferase-like [Babylonia areolata]|uniref:2-hydroxyacylsphingosine 1-beta-galactosyltransferase-like n=1 Tax=Babylonia areolata TaxID=304850 RepID=UPI003FCFB376
MSVPQRRSLLALSVAVHCSLLTTMTTMMMTTTTSSDAKRVLLMPFPTPSRTILHLEVARSLMSRGHDVTLVLCDWIVHKGVTNTTGMSVIDYHTTMNFEEAFVNDLLRQFFAGDVRGTPLERYHAFYDEILSNESLLQEMRPVGADLFVFDDDLAITKMFAVFAYRLGVPFACLDFSFQPFNRRIPFSPAAVPAYLSDFGDRMTLLERLQNTWTFLRDQAGTPLFLHDAVARYAPEKEYLPLDRLVAQAEVWLIESDPIMQFPYPTLPNVKHVGGIMASPPSQPLVPRFKSFMDGAGEAGVLVVSFGSMVLNLPSSVTDTLMTAFLRLSPMRVVFRANVTSPDPARILTSVWIPQNSLLAHPKCRVFVGHGGMSGHYQALYHAVPVLDLPLLYDQVQNAKAVHRKGFGLYLHIREMTADDMVRAVTELTHNPSYRATISRASRLYRELYGVPRETASYWLDHVMTYGGHYMRSSGQEMPLYQFLLVDVLLIVGLGLVVLVALKCACACWVYRVVCKRKRKQKGE